jgi:hypothetical protein
MASPRFQIFLATVLMHGVMLLCMWLWWPQLKPQAARFASTTIEVRLPLSEAATERPSAAADATAPQKPAIQHKATRRATRTDATHKSPAETALPGTAIELKLETPAPALSNTDANNQSAAPAVDIKPPIVGNDAQRQAIKQALQQPGIAQQTNQQLGQLGVGKLSSAQAFSNEVKKAELEECLASNENGGLLSLLFIAVKKSKGKCK